MRASGGWCRQGARPAAAGALALGMTLVAFTLVAGCGGSGTLSRRELVARANGACHHANTRVTALSRPAAGLTGVADYAGKLQPIASGLVSDLAKLKPPNAVRSGFERYVAELRTGVAKLPRLKAAASRGDAGTVQRLSAEIGSRPTDRLATQLGLRECAKHPAPQRAG